MSGFGFIMLEGVISVASGRMDVSLDLLRRKWENVRGYNPQDNRLLNVWGLGGCVAPAEGRRKESLSVQEPVRCGQSFRSPSWGSS
eukprot:scaffold112822_cov23-Tisochrysis_lutea.AAC.1